MYEVNLTYFNKNGKYFSQGSFETHTSNLNRIWDDVKIMAEENKLPGLIGLTYEIIIAVDVPDHPHNHPHLVIL